MSRKKLSTTVYITPEQDVQLKELHRRTRVPVAEYIRQGIDLVLEKYADQLPGQAALELEASPERPPRRAEPAGARAATPWATRPR